MFKKLENYFRRLIREELDLYFGQRPRQPETMEIHNNETGADLIMPNFIKEAFDEGKITSIGDIV
ncbi:MAG: hypothetical protein KGL39_46580 [Patescibacteria group bacterium]|nr:hypothetical protein [Patescibacteria group bacterium]